jgi:hypothetical protein
VLSAGNDGFMRRPDADIHVQFFMLLNENQTPGSTVEHNYDVISASTKLLRQNAPLLVPFFMVLMKCSWFRAKLWLRFSGYYTTIAISRICPGLIFLSFSIQSIDGHVFPANTQIILRINDAITTRAKTKLSFLSRVLDVPGAAVEQKNEFGKATWCSHVGLRCWARYPSAA